MNKTNNNNNKIKVTMLVIITIRGIYELTWLKIPIVLN
jgi:hypothetical protein